MRNILWALILCSQTVLSEVLFDCDLDSAPSSENNGGEYTCSLRNIILDVRNGLPTNMFDHVTGADCWGGTGGCGKIFGSVTGGGSYRGFTLGSYTGGTTQLNLRYLKKWNSSWRGAANLKGNYLDGPRWTQEKAMNEELGGFQMALSYDGTLYYAHGNGQTEGTCDSGGYYCCEYKTNCNLGSGVAAAGPFFFADYDNEWVAIEIEQLSSGTLRLYIWTQDGTYNGLYMEALNVDAGTPGITGFSGMYFHDADAASGSFMMVDEVKIAEEYIGPPTGFGDAPTPTYAPVLD